MIRTTTFPAKQLSQKTKARWVIINHFHITKELLLYRKAVQLYSLMLGAIRDDAWQVLNMQHVTLNQLIGPWEISI